MTVPVTYWYDRIIPRCSGLDETLFPVALHTVMRRYFRDSGAWTDDLVLSATAGTDTIDIDAQYIVPTETYKRTAQILTVWIEDKRINPLTRPYFNYRYHENPQLFWWADQANVLRFSAPLSEDTSDLKVHLTVQPSDGVNGVPDFIEAHHDEGIESGLLAYFYSMPAKPWTSVPLASHFKGEFEEHIAEMRAVAERGYTPADIQWAYPRSFV